MNTDLDRAIMTMIMGFSDMGWEASPRYQKPEINGPRCWYGNLMFTDLDSDALMALKYLGTENEARFTWNIRTSRLGYKCEIRDWDTRGAPIFEGEDEKLAMAICEALGALIESW